MADRSSGGRGVGKGSSKRTPVQLAGALGVAMLLVAAIVGVASQPGANDAAMPAPSRLALGYVLDLLFFLFLAIGLIVLAGVVWALWPRPGDEPITIPRPPTPWPLRVIIAMLPLVLLCAMFLIASAGRHPGQPSLRFLAPAAPLAQGAPAADDGTGGTAAVAAALTVVALLAAAAIAIAVMLRRRSGTDARAGRPREEDLAEAVELGLDALRVERDPRRAVIAAYAALEGSLTRSGLPRARHEAPFEYVLRALDRLPHQSGDLHRMAELFELAKFSHHDIDHAMREEAIDALVRVRDGLRTARAS